MSLSAMLYFAANPSASDSDVLARLTRNIRKTESGARDSMRARIGTGIETGTLSRRITEKQRK